MKTTQISRRNFLKLASLLSLSSLAPRQLTRQSGTPNIILVLFDAWSFTNIGMFGYPRQTMPLLEKLADQAVVYHNHYAGGPWTIPGTASLLTGTYPWTHRVFTPEQINLRKRDRSIFNLMQQAGYTTSAASHNIYADDLLSQLNHYLDIHPHFLDLFLPTHFPLTRLFKQDLEASGLAQFRAFWNKEKINSAVFLGEFFRKIIQSDMDRIEDQHGDLFPRGVPGIPVLDLHFLLEDGIDHLLHTVANLPQPYFSYYHFYPPHQPYRTRKEFVDRFKNDGIDFPEKPPSTFSEGHPQQKINRARRMYDETLLYVDAEFHRLYNTLKSSGQLDNTWLILTSDHGELFERGNIGHETPIGYNPEIKIPLFIFPPQQHKRTDIFNNTSAVDLLPTLQHLAGQPVPDWAEGIILPPFSSKSPPKDRSVYVLHPVDSRSRKPLSEGSAVIFRENMKLIFTFGIGANSPYIELYDLETDPEELENLYTPDHPVGKLLLDEVSTLIEQADAPYR